MGGGSLLPKPPWPPPAEVVRGYLHNGVPATLVLGAVFAGVDCLPSKTKTWAMVISGTMFCHP